VVTRSPIDRTCSILLLCGGRQTLSRNVERKCETNNIEMDGGGMSCGF